MTVRRLLTCGLFCAFPYMLFVFGGIETAQLFRCVLRETKRKNKFHMILVHGNFCTLIYGKKEIWLRDNVVMSI
jgi:hypothetical protein